MDKDAEDRRDFAVHQQGTRDYTPPDGLDDFSLPSSIGGRSLRKASKFVMKEESMMEFLKQSFDELTLIIDVIGQTNIIVNKKELHSKILPSFNMFQTSICHV